MSTQPFGPDEQREAKKELRNKQTKAEWVVRPNLDNIRALESLVTRRARARSFLSDDIDYNRLKAAFLDELDKVPALKFNNQDGYERYATAYHSSKLEVDVELLLKVLAELGYDEAMIDKILPRKHNAEALRRAASKDVRLRERLPEFAREVPHVSYVTFSDPITDEEVDDVT